MPNHLPDVGVKTRERYADPSGSQPFVQPDEGA